LNLVEIDDEACIIGVMKTDALPAEYGQMIGAVEMFDPFWVFLAQLFCECILVLFSAGTTSLLEIKVSL
jgi:hypothetical protein